MAIKSRSLSAAGTIVVFDVSNINGYKEISLPGPMPDYDPSNVCAICFLNDSAQLAVAAAEKILIFDTYTGRLLRSSEGHTSAVTSLHRLGDRLLTGSWDATVRMWNADDLLEIQQLPVPGDLQCGCVSSTRGCCCICVEK
jgi:WD40 repeat protein